MDASDAASAGLTRKRLRTSHACDTCRARKIRCNGAHPCAKCCASDIDCTYGSEANSRGKGDLVLEGILRIEKSLLDLNASISSFVHSNSHQQKQQQSPNVSSRGSFARSYPQHGIGTLRASHLAPTPTGEVQRDDEHSFNNAVLDPMHTSTTESILQWPHFDNFPSLRANYVPIFRLEQSQPALVTKRATTSPYVTTDDVSAILDSFGHHVNFWYPTMSQHQLRHIRSNFQHGVPDEDSVETCLGLLTMALGCASQTTEGLNQGRSLTEDELQRRLLKRKIGDAYFEAALKKIHVAHLQVSSEATQCLLFVALYFAFLVRPLQGWEYLSTTAAKCLLLLAYPRAEQTSEEQERIRRIFWSCYILESDYVAELSACPPSGIAGVESSVLLPGTYQTHLQESEEEQSSLYFLACISMRRLLNRVHHLLYSRDSGAALDTARFHRIVAELKHQLDKWRDILPPAFAFSLGTEPTATECGGFLRQRYLTCQGVIYRPYLMWVLGGGSGIAADAPSQGALSNCKACLDACLMHVLNLRSFSHTVLVDTWICSLSMAGTMLVLLSACQTPVLRGLIEPEVLKLGDHLTDLFQSWRRLSLGRDSPGVEQSLWVIDEADS
ncbi:hypothetical protein B0J15DRAFT_530525 [Fusarium solani]|uniref:Zn(2)-C6 fungal-type domain-containing protein n=1 Tax=Fusarium solani TaxID=169388 RepID=A0A9P9JSD2_FUSSL|nr:uncharacterized protein B0J15DRAFT_530525 [Fusarium solani]KAH7231536.1 hypothetical protein B0J15DRAFT_530525 [Fusarium solani]